MGLKALPVDHFVWQPIPSPKLSALPFLAALMAADSAGNLVTNYFGTVTVSAQLLSLPSLLISEIDNGVTNQVEFTNPSTNSVDVSGWTIVFYDKSHFPSPTTQFTIPAGTICPAESVFVVAAGGNAPGAFPAFFLGTSLAWSLSANPSAVALLDNSNHLVDFFCASTAYPFLITNPVPIVPSNWYGVTVSQNSKSTFTYQRQGDFNHREAIDWVATNRTIGVLNTNISLPFATVSTTLSVLPNPILITNGLWSGFLSVEGSGSNVFLEADNENGNPGLSNPFNIVPTTPVCLSLPTQTFTTNPGVEGAMISLPQAIGLDLSFVLASSNPSKIGVPSQVLIPAGNVSAGFNVTNYNDSMVDGVQLVTITASNYLFAPVQATITNFSAPLPLQLILPGSISQQPGGTNGQGTIITSAAVTTNFQALLSSSDGSILTVPATVRIAAGQTNATFTFAIASGPQILGSRVETITASAGPGATTNASITVSGNQAFNLNLTVPKGPLLEGAGLVGNGTVTIGGTLPTNLVIALTSSVPTLVNVPSSVVIPSGQTSAAFGITVLSNSIPGTDVAVMILTSSPGFTPTNALISIQDTHLDHFAFSQIPATEVINKPFTVSVIAENRSGDIQRSYNGFVSLSVGGLPLGDISPTMTGSFTNGLWVGPVTITAGGTNVILEAQDGAVTAQSNPFSVEPPSVFVVNSTVASLVYDSGTDRIYASIPASSTNQSNTVMRLNPYTETIETNIAVDTNPGLMVLSASNKYIYVTVQSSFFIERFNLASQTPDLEFGVMTDFPQMYAANVMSLPSSPQSIAVAGISPYGPSGDFIFDGNVSRTNLSDLTLAPGLDQGATLSSADVGYLQNGVVLTAGNPTPLGQFIVPGTIGSRDVAPDPASQKVFFLAQSGGQSTIYAYNSTTFTLEGSEVISGVNGSAQNLIRWGTNGLAFSTTGNQIFLIESPLIPIVSEARLGVSQSGPSLTTAGNDFTITINVTNSGTAAANDVALLDPLPSGANFVSVSSSQGTVGHIPGMLSGILGTVGAGSNATVVVTFSAQSPGTLTNVVTLTTSTPDSAIALETSTWMTTVNSEQASNQVTQLPLFVNDLAYNSVDGFLYASVSGEQAAFGNSVVAIDPNSMQVVHSIPVGPNPGALALAADGRYLYVYLNNSATFDLVDLQQQTVTFQNSIYSLALSEMFVLPGTADSLLFAQHNPAVSPSEAGVQIITGGVANVLANAPGMSLVQPSLASNVFYGYDNDVVPSAVSRVQINGTNLTSTSVGGLSLDIEPEIRSGGDLLFFAWGEVVDPESMLRLATFPGLSHAANQICANTSSGRVYYLASSGSSATLMAYSLNTYQITGSLTVPGIVGTPEQLVRWGQNGLAFATSGGQLFSIQTPLVPTNPPADLVVNQALSPSAMLLSNYPITVTVSNRGPGAATSVTVQDILPTGMSFVTASPTQGSYSTNAGVLTVSFGTLASGATAQVTVSLRPQAFGSSFNYVRVAANEGDPIMTNNSSYQSISTPFAQNVPMTIGDIVYDPTRGKLFVTTQNDGAYSNSIIQIDPITGGVEKVLPTTFVPGKISVTSDGQFLYVGTVQTSIIARIDIASWTNDLSWPLGMDPNNIGYIAADFASLAGHPHTIVASLHTSYGSYTPKVVIYDDGVARSDLLVESGGGTYFVQASPDASTLYVINGDTAQGYAINPATFSAHPILTTGIGAAPTNISGYSSDFRIEDNLMVTDIGQLFNLTNNTALGTFPVSGLVSPLYENGIVYFLVQTGSEGVPAWTLMACSTNTFNVVWQVTIPDATGNAYSLTPCGPNLLAFATTPSGNMNYGLIPTARQLFLVNTTALPSAGDLVMTVATNSALAGRPLTNVFTVVNNGPFFATGVKLTNLLPGGSVFLSATSTQGSCSQTNGIVSAAIGSMTPNSSVSVTVISIVSSPGPIPVSASVSKNEPDLDAGNNQISLTESIYPAPSIQIGDVTAYRQAGQIANFNIQFDSVTPIPFQLYFSTSNGTALANRDYVSASSIVTIPAGTLQTNFSVGIRDSGLVEPSLTFNLNASLSSTSAPLATAICTLFNYDFYSFSSTNITVTAGSIGETNATFLIKLSGSNFSAASVDYLTLDGSAVSGTDYLAKAGTLLFAPGVTNASVAIPVYPKLGPAPAKSFFLVFANPINGVLTTPQATGSILYTNFPLALGPSHVLADGRFQITAEGGTLGQTYNLLASTNLLNWNPIASFVDTNTPIILYDPAATNFERRFYRLGTTN